MNGAVFLFLFLALIALLIARGMWSDGEDGVALVAFVFCIGLAWCAWEKRDTPENLAKAAAEEKQKQDQRQLEITPRKVSSADGCTVYAFKPSDRWLYFTKCENAEATTHNEWTVSTGSGKTHSSHTESMEIKSK